MLEICVEGVGGENVVISKFRRKGRRQLLATTAAERERTTTTTNVLLVFIDAEDSTINFTPLVLRNLCFSRSKKNKKKNNHGHQKKSDVCDRFHQVSQKEANGRRTERSISVPVLEELSSHKY